jgi:hypothetical protein
MKKEGSKAEESKAREYLRYGARPYCFCEGCIVWALDQLDAYENKNGVEWEKK